jgi:hypothetical protein
MLLHDMFDPSENFDELLQQLNMDKEILKGIWKTRYLRGCTHIPKQENLSLAWEYAQSPDDHQ